MYIYLVGVVVRHKSNITSVTPGGHAISHLTDEEIDSICAGFKQNAAKVRYLKLRGLTVARKPNGRPLVSRSHFDDVMSGSPMGTALDASGITPVWGVH